MLFVGSFLVLLATACKDLCYLRSMQQWFLSQHAEPVASAAASKAGAKKPCGAKPESEPAKPKKAPQQRTSRAYIRAGGQKRRSRGRDRDGTKRHYEKVATQETAQQDACE